jgi:cysteine-rich repeat protein
MKRRLVALAVVSSSIFVAATCVHDDLVECAGGVSCPVGLRCVEDPLLSQSTCANDDQFAACTTAPTGTQCSVGDAIGTCFGGACIVEVCGDSVIQGREACDDGNTVGSDGCSANCVSTEACGDGVIDLLQGEQCDDGVRGLSGDGCSSNCKVEYPFWFNVTPTLPSSRYGYGFTQSPNGGVMLYGGTSGSSGDAVRATYSETWEHDGVTWGRLAPPASPPALTRVAMAYDPRRDRVVLFGGLDASGAFVDETWEFDGVTWVKLSPATHPTARVDAAFACSPTRCVLFGGRNGTTQGSGAMHQDTWSWDGTSWSEVANSGSGMPPARSAAGMTFDTRISSFVLWGGRNTTNSLVDTHEMTDGATFWVQRTNGPVGMSTGLPVIAYSPSSMSTWVYAPSGTYTYASGWGSAMPLPVHQDALAWNDRTERLVATSNGMLDRTYSNEGSNWTLRSNVRPAGSRSAPAAYDATRGLTMIYERTNGTWAWDGQVYRRAAASNPMTSPNVEDASLAFDEACGDLLLYGGYNPSTGTVVDETWRFDGARWHEIETAGPPARFQHAMVYDPVRNATIVFGGQTRTGVDFISVGDTWQLAGPCNARVWTELSVTGPSARFGSPIAFDRERGVAVLFGGDAGDNVNDIWEWNGSAWEQRTPASADVPAARHATAIGFDPRLRRVVLAGGRTDEFTRFSDVWTWDGTAFAQLAPLVVPPARSGAKLLQDRRGTLVMYGGDNAQSFATSDLQRLRFDQTLHDNERCQLATDDVDRDGLTGCDDPDCRARCAPSCSVAIPYAQCTGPKCGDGQCAPVEDRGICPSDCP